MEKSEWLQNGSRGDRVAELQRKLAAKGVNAGAADGIFGPKTEAAVRRFQEEHGLQVDGIAGPETFTALGMMEAEAPQNVAAARPEEPKTEVRSEVISPKKDAAPSGTEALRAAEAKAEEEAEEKADAIEAVAGAMKAAEAKAEEAAEEEAPKGFKAKIQAMLDARRERKGK